MSLANLADRVRNDCRRSLADLAASIPVTETRVDQLSRARNERSRLCQERRHDKEISELVSKASKANAKANL